MLPLVRPILLSSLVTALAAFAGCGTVPHDANPAAQAAADNVREDLAQTDMGRALDYPAAYETKLLTDANQSFDLFTSSTVVQSGNYLGMNTVPAAVAADLNVVVDATANTNNTLQLRGAQASLTPSPLSAASTLRLPRQGNAVWGVNVDAKLRQFSSLAVNLRFDPNDLDPLDARLRLRVVAAPVLSPGTHASRDQAMNFLSLENRSRNNLPLASFVRYGSQAGIPWLTDGALAYTDWQLVEFTPSIKSVALSETVRLNMTASRCSAGGHYGAMYVDEVGTFDAGGTTLVAYGPELVTPGGQLVYPVRLRHKGAADANNVRLTFAPPTGTQFVAFNAPQSWNCTLPPVQSSNQVLCTVPQLASGYAGMATLVVNVPAGSPNTLVLGNYGVTTASQVRLLGPTVNTNVVLDANRALGDLTSHVAEDTARATATTSTLVATLHNFGPAAAAGAYISDAVGPHLVVQSWSCTATAGAKLSGSAKAQGTGPLATSYDLAANSNVVCDVVVARDGSGVRSTYGVAVAAPVNFTDPVSYNSEGVSFVAGTYTAPATLPPDTTAAPAPRTCTTAQDCNGRACMDGYCCDAACNQPCQACDVTGHEGTCTALDQTEAKLGHGGCGPYLCGEGNCLTSCTSNDHCIATLTCQAGVCRPKVGVCTTDADCSAGLTCTVAKTCESLAMQDPNSPNWALEGSGCAAGGGRPGGGLGLVVALGLVARGRRLARRRVATAAVWALATALGLGAAAPAHAADSSSLPTNPYLPLGGLDDLFGSAAAPKAAAGSFYLGAQVNYANAPLRLRHTTPPRVSQNIVAHQGTLDLAAGVALPFNTEVDFALPLVLQEDRKAAFASAQLNREYLQFSPGDLRLTPKWTLYRGERAKVALAAVVGLPSGRRNAYVGRGMTSVTPMAVADFGRSAGLRILLNAGVTLQNHRTFAGINSHHSVRWSAAGEYPIAVGRATLALKATAFGQMDLIRPRAISSPIEALAGLGVWLPQNLFVDVGGGAGLSRGYGAPRWRLLASLGWRPLRRDNQEALPVEVPQALAPVTAAASEDAEAEVAATSLATDPNGDDDGDGVRNADDACPTVAGDPNGTPPGCPAVQAAGVALGKLRLVYFGSNEAVVVAEDAAALDQVRQVMLALPKARLLVEGHTDDVGEPRHNKRLSLARAEATRRWLVDHGVAARRIDVQGLGDARPLDRRRTAAARAKNRRVVFVLLPASHKAAAAARPAARPAAKEADGQASADADAGEQGEADNF